MTRTRVTHTYVVLELSKDAVDEINDKLRAERENETTAALKAKLDMVETRRKPGHGRHPRKIGEMVCYTGINDKYRKRTISFPLRLDGSDFIAEHGDLWYVSKSRDALQARMNEVAKVALDLKWSRYLLIKYKATVPSNYGLLRGTTTLDLTDHRRNDTVVLGIELTWRIVEYSDGFQVPGSDLRFMGRDVVNGEPATNEESVNALPDGLVPYTKEREHMLEKLREALAQVDRRMTELFRGTSDNVGERMDQLIASGARLLEAPREQPIRKKR